MSVATEAKKLTIRARDVSGQKSARVKNCPPDCSVGELVQGFLARMHLPPNDVEGRALTYSARLEREGRALLGSEVVGEALQDEDRIVLQPNVDAGGR